MNNYQTQYSGTYYPYSQKAVYPDSIETKRIRKTFSNIAWALMVSEIFIYVFYFAFSVFLYAAGFEESYTADEMIIENAPIVLMCYTSVTFALICASLIFGSGFHFRVSDLFGRDKITGKKLLLTVLISLGAANAVYVINIMLSSAAYQLGYELPSAISDPQSAPGWVAEVISTVILAPVFEEIFYRGIIMRAMSGISRYFAIFASSAVFGLVHGNIYQFLLGFAVGVVFAYADMKMDSIIPSIIAHIAVNSHLYIYYAYTGEYADFAYLLSIGAFIIIGTIALLYLLKTKGIDFPEYTEYHKKRCMPILLRSIPAWFYVIYSVYGMFSAFEKI